MEFLSDSWFSAANVALSNLDLGETQIVIHNSFSEGPIESFYLCLDGTSAYVSKEPPAETPNVMMKQSWETAMAVRDGSVSALTAIQDGRIAIEGDIRKLIAAGPALSQVDFVIAAIS
ncbi:MAG: SCP2 sterol-binding domain-containing protein [Actinomycetota bacterium]